MTDISSKHSCRTLKLPIEILMEEIRPVIAQKYEFENGDESKSIAFFAIFRLQHFNARKRIDVHSIEWFATS